MRIAELAIALGKNVRSVVGLDSSGAEVLRLRGRRDMRSTWSKTAEFHCGMDACCGAHHLGRRSELRDMTFGRRHRIMSGLMSWHRRTTIVSRGNCRRGDASNDAFRRDEDRDPLDMQTLHRSRERLIGERTARHQLRQSCWTAAAQSRAHDKLRRTPEADGPEGRLSSSSPNHAAGTHQNLGAMVSEPT